MGVLLMINTLVSAIIGSGTIPYTYGILSPDKGGVQAGAEGVRTGHQVLIANLEDWLGVDKWMTSGIFVLTTPIKIWSPEINLLPRQRTLIIQNTTTNTNVFAGPTEESILTRGFVSRFVSGFAYIMSLPLMHNNTLWVRSNLGSDVRIIAF